MQLKSNKKYRLSKSGTATQVILHCHGAWSIADGHIVIPIGLVINFYGPHGNFGTRGQTIAQSLLGASNGQALDNLTLRQLMEESVNQKWTSDELEEAIRQAKASANSQGNAESMQVFESVTGGGGLFTRQKVYNYSLSYTGPRDNEQVLENTFSEHQGGTLNADVDLLVMKPNASGHLESAVKFALDEGGKYSVLHFLPCRYVDTSDTKSMKTVHLPDFGNEDFKVSSAFD